MLFSLQKFFEFVINWTVFAVQGRPAHMMFVHFKSLIQISRVKAWKAAFCLKVGNILTFMGQIYVSRRTVPRWLANCLATGWTWFDHFSNQWRTMTVWMKMPAQRMGMSELKSYLKQWFPFSLGTQKLKIVVCNFVI